MNVFGAQLKILSNNKTESYSDTKLIAIEEKGTWGQAISGTDCHILIANYINKLIRIWTHLTISSLFIASNYCWINITIRCACLPFILLISTIELFIIVYKCGSIRTAFRLTIRYSQKKTIFSFFLSKMRGKYLSILSYHKNQT